MRNSRTASWSTPASRRGLGRSGLKTFGFGVHELPLVVLQQRVCQLVLLGVRIFDVADGAAGTARHRRHALIALAADPGRKLDRSVLPDLLLPFRVYLGE